MKHYQPNSDITLVLPPFSLQVLDDKYQCQQKEKGSNSTETVRLMEEINRKKQQYDMEVKVSLFYVWLF